MVYEFSKQNRVGQVGEEVVKAFFDSKQVEYSSTNVPGYQYKSGKHEPDFWFINKYGETEGLEVKVDEASVKYGNVCFEEAALTHCIRDGGTLIMYFVRKNHEVLLFNLVNLAEELCLPEYAKYYKKQVGNSASYQTNNSAWCLPLSLVLKLQSRLKLELDDEHQLATLFINS